MVAENTRRIIEERGLKQKSVAEKAGYSPKVFNDLLNGRKIIRELDIVKISSALGVPPNELFSMVSSKSATA